MCGRYVLDNPGQIVSRFNIEEAGDFEFDANYNIAPSYNVPVIYKDNKKYIELMKWGLVPSWAKDIKIGYKMINARAETVGEKVSYRKSLKSRRCLVPATGFYEWKKEGKEKIPYFIRPKDIEMFAFAGIYDIWKDAENKELKTFTIITTDANAAMIHIHDRMPLILQKTEEEKWLGNELDEIGINELLKPYDRELMIKRVSNEVNSPANNFPELLNTIE